MSDSPADIRKQCVQKLRAAAKQCKVEQGDGEKILLRRDKSFRNFLRGNAGRGRHKSVRAARARKAHTQGFPFGPGAPVQC